MWSQQSSWHLCDGSLIEMSADTLEINSFKNIFLVPNVLILSLLFSVPTALPWVTTSSFLRSRGREVKQCIRWGTQCRTHLTLHPNNGGWPWAAPLINHLTFSSRHQLPSPRFPPCVLSWPEMASSPKKEKNSSASCAHEGWRQSPKIPHDCKYKSDGSNYPSSSRGPERASRLLFNFDVVQPFSTQMGGELWCMSGQSRTWS